MGSPLAADTRRRSPMYLLVEARLGEPLEDYVIGRRDPDAQHSWRLIAEVLSKTTDVKVSPETLRQWFPGEV